MYFDSSATTRPCAEAVSAALECMTENYGNPSSLHYLGIKANDALSLARQRVSDAIGCKKENFYFAPSGTIANNAAIFGTYERLRRDGNRIVTTALEHPSVQGPIRRLAEQYGVEVITLLPGKDGAISERELFETIDKNTVLVSIMALNNETGVPMPIAAARQAVMRAKSPAVIHSDCVQAFGKITIAPAVLGADLITVSAHKIHGLKGVGGLYAKNLNRLKPLFLGGGQEEALFSGTEPMPAICAFGAAAAALPDIQTALDYISILKKRLLTALEGCDRIVINSPANALPYIVNLSVLGMPSQPIVNALSEKGLCISAGSACKKGQRSTVLTAMKLPPAVIDSAVRVSFSRFNTESEVDLLADALLGLTKK